MYRRLPLRPLLAVAAASLVLAGCGSAPGQAVVVGDTSLSMERLDTLAEAGCQFVAVQAAAQGGAAPSQGQVRQIIASQELQLAGARQVADERGLEVSPSAWELGADDVTQLETMLEGQDITTVREVLERDYETQQLRVAIGADETGTPATEANMQTLYEAGGEIVAAALEELDPTVDPRFGIDAAGADDPSLRLSVSRDEIAEIDPSTLPANQQCTE